MNNIEEELHKIIQDEIAGEVWYDNRHCELKLSNCLVVAEKKLKTFIKELLVKRDDYWKNIILQLGEGDFMSKEESVLKAEIAWSKLLKSQEKKIRADIEKELDEARTDLVNEVVHHTRTQEKLHNCEKKIREEILKEYDKLFGEKHHLVCEGLKCECHKQVKELLNK